MNRRIFLGLCAGAAAGYFSEYARSQMDTPTTKPAMLTRSIPSTGEQLPVIGMGTWQTFDPPALSPEHLQPLSEVLRIFHANGGRLIDSSPMYGQSETVTGRLSEELGINGELFLATKVWTRGRQEGIDQINDSLAKLNRKNLELMQIHNLVDWQTHLQTLREWKHRERFRYIGITHYQRGSFDDLERIMKTERLDFVQLPYSIDFRDAEERLLPIARDTGTAVLTMRPFGGGSLFAKVKGKPLPDHVKPYANSWAQAFLKFLLSHEAVTAVIPATSKPAHMEDNIQAGFGQLPTAMERAQLSAIF